MRQLGFAPVECDDWLDPLSPAYERQQTKRLRDAEAQIVKHGHALAAALAARLPQKDGTLSAPKFRRSDMVRYIAELTGGEKTDI